MKENLSEINESEKLVENESDNRKNINNTDSKDDNILDTKGKKLIGKTKLRGKKKEKKDNFISNIINTNINNDINTNINNDINTNENNEEKYELTEKERMLIEARETFMKNKEAIDDDHFLIIRSPQIKGDNILINEEQNETKLRGRNKRNIAKVKEYRQNLELNNNIINNKNEININTDSNIINTDEDNAIEIKENFFSDAYNKFVRNAAEHSKKTDK